MPFFTQHPLCLCVCLYLWGGGFYYAEVCTSPPHHTLLWPSGLLLLPLGIAIPVTARSPATRASGGGNRTWFIRCCTSTSSAHKIWQETELLFTFVKAATTAALKCWRGHNMRLFHRFPSPSGMGKSMFDTLVFNGFVQYRQSYLPVIVLPKKSVFSKFIPPTSMVFPPK